MAEQNLQPKRVLDAPTRLSYWFMFATLVLTGWLHLATPLLVSLFAFFALSKLDFLKRRGKWLAILLFFVLVCGVAYGLGFVINQTVRNLPLIAEQAIPQLIRYAQKYKIELPFTDYDSLKEAGMEAVKNQVHYMAGVAKFARGATAQFAFILIGLVVAINLFIDPQLELGRHKHAVRNNLYSTCCDQIAHRFLTFYRSFATVMGAQLVISAINTVLTAIFVLVVQLPYAIVVIGMTFLCGLLPVIGNLVSNSIVVGIGLTVSPTMALVALIFLVVIHKLEYFLNSKIVGDRIQNPLWLTLLALIVGEKLMGIPGMILAPIVLHYLKMETSVIEVYPPSPRH
jgi:predicted PurR-regulated permease PerM